MIDVELKGRLFVMENERQKLEIFFSVKGVAVCFLFSGAALKEPIGFALRGCLRIPHGWHDSVSKVDLVVFNTQLRGYMRVITGNG